MRDDAAYGVAVAALILIAAAIICTCIAIGLAYGVPLGFIAFGVICLITSLLLFRWVSKEMKR